MWISRLDARGLAGSADHSWSLDRVESGGDPRLLDALALFSAALAPARRPVACRRLGWPEAVDDELPLRGPAPEVAEARHPAVVIEGVVALDPPLFGRLRDAVLRDPQLAAGLADGTLTIRVGWAFTGDRRVVRPDVLGLAVGRVTVPLAELPTWWPELARTIGERILLLDAAPEDRASDVRTALLGPSPDHRSRAHDLLAWGGWSIVEQDGHAVTRQRGDLLPLRWRGPAEAQRLQVATAALLDRPDVLVLPTVPDASLVDALREWTTGDDAVLEQTVSA
jgi:hypothetical protein